MAREKGESRRCVKKITERNKALPKHLADNRNLMA